MKMGNNGKVGVQCIQPKEPVPMPLLPSSNVFKTKIAVTTSARTEQLVKRLSLGDFRRSDIEVKRVQWSVQLGNFFN
ncbi:hypothetical protein TNCV_4443511 [Trichonephila clavipes]|nr:hypothetical protein TNCV_4443511 [Trichonephila clavipes]